MSDLVAELNSMDNWSEVYELFTEDTEGQYKVNDLELSNLFDKVRKTDKDIIRKDTVFCIKKIVADALSKVTPFNTHSLERATIEAITKLEILVTEPTKGRDSIGFIDIKNYCEKVCRDSNHPSEKRGVSIYLHIKNKASKNVKNYKKMKTSSILTSNPSEIIVNTIKEAIDAEDYVSSKPLFIKETTHIKEILSHLVAKYVLTKDAGLLPLLNSYLIGKRGMDDIISLEDRVLLVKSICMDENFFHLSDQENLLYLIYYVKAQGEYLEGFRLAEDWVELNAYRPEGVPSEKVWLLAKTLSDYHGGKGYKNLDHYIEYLENFI